jgi:hypothetical protein
VKIPQTVTVDVRGETHAGTYVVSKGMLTVTSPLGSKPPTRIGAAPAKRLAKIILGEIVMEARIRGSSGARGQA